jgi:predicted nucleotidyltransferase
MKTEGRDQFLLMHPELERMIRDLPDEVHAVILFGSRATGKAAPFSDIDICFVIAPDPRPGLQRTLLSFGSKTIQVSLFSDLPPSVRFRVFRDGILLFCRDPLALHRARAAAVRGYLNVRPLIDRHIARTFG